MKTNYTNYKAEQLLEDDFFINSILHPTEETELFWEIQVTDGIIDKEEMMTAIYFLRSMQVRKRRMSSSELSEVWERIENTNRMSISHKAKPLYKLIIAASFALLIASSIFYVWERNKENNELFMIAQSIKPDSVVSDVQLVLANNEYISINNKKINIQYDQKGNIHINDKKLKQENSATPQKEKDVALLHKINQLIVPKGRRSTLTFSDGTVLWVNSGSRVVYPEQFEAKQREIYIDGEAYLQVSPDKSRPFIVKTNKIDIKVLGTTFNITAYEEDDRQAVALVEGSVEIISDKKKLAALTPNDLFQYKNGQINIEQTDITQYISWVEGWYIFESEQLPSILDRLSRYYGKEIKYHKKEIEMIRCSGKLDLKDDLNKVLDALINTAPIRYATDKNVYSVSYRQE